MMVNFKKTFLELYKLWCLARNYFKQARFKQRPIELKEGMKSLFTDVISHTLCFLQEYIIFLILLYVDSNASVISLINFVTRQNNGFLDYF